MNYLNGVKVHWEQIDAFETEQEGEIHIDIKFRFDGEPATYITLSSFPGKKPGRIENHDFILSPTELKKLSRAINLALQTIRESIPKQKR